MELLNRHVSRHAYVEPMIIVEDLMMAGPICSSGNIEDYNEEEFDWE